MKSKSKKRRYTKSIATSGRLLTSLAFRKTARIYMKEFNSISSMDQSSMS